MKLKPLGKRLILEEMENVKQTAGGIYIPDTASEKQNKAKVVAVGDKVEGDIKEGDIVIYSKYAPSEIEIDDKKYLIIKEEDILAKVEN